LTYANARVIFRQGIDQSAFIYHLYDLFIDFIDSAPTVSTLKAEGDFKERQSIWAATLCYTCFNFFFELFYVLSPDGKFTKIVPHSIGDFIDAKAFAYWIMSDGSKVEQGGLILHTEGFTLEEVKFLIKV